MNERKFHVKGAFGTEINEVYLHVNKRSKELIIFLHGVFSSPFRESSKRYLFLSKKISCHTSVGYYQTSRMFEWYEKPELSFEEFSQLSFKGKTFNQEFVDVKNSFYEIVKRTKSKIKSDKLKITLVGFSLGGIMSILLTEFSSEISNIFLFGTGINFTLNQSSIMDSLPSTHKLEKIINGYKNNLFIYRGSGDSFATQKQSYSIYQSATNANIRVFAEFKGVDHRFMMKDTKDMEDQLNDYIFKLIKNNKEQY